MRIGNCALCILVAIGLAATPHAYGQASIKPVFEGPAVTDDPSLALWLSNPIGSFNASGQISSLIFEGTTQRAIVSGNWSLSVIRGNITDFSVNFTEVETDGLGRHTHSLTEFGMNVVAPVLLDDRGTVFTGQSEITMDGYLTWYAVQTNVEIYRQDVIKISFSDESATMHFHDQPIFGVVNSIQS